MIAAECVAQFGVADRGVGTGQQHQQRVFLAAGEPVGEAEGGKLRFFRLHRMVVLGRLRVAAPDACDARAGLCRVDAGHIDDVIEAGVQQQGAVCRGAIAEQADLDLVAQDDLVLAQDEF